MQKGANMTHISTCISFRLNDIQKTVYFSEKLDIVYLQLLAGYLSEWEPGTLKYWHRSLGIVLVVAAGKKMMDGLLRQNSSTYTLTGN